MNKVKFLLLLFPLHVFGQINLTSIGNTYTETFGTGLISSWTNNSTFPGWYLSSDGTFNFVATTNITTAAPPNTGGFYTYKCNGVNDLKLGSRPSNGSGGTAGTGLSYMGMRLKNTTGTTITSLAVSFEAFQLSKAENDCNPNLLTFSYRVATSVTSLTTGTWINVPALDYTAPNNDCSGGTSAQLVGYPCTVSSNLSNCISVSIPPNSEIVLRWGDINNQANDPHLAIDNIAVTPLQTVTIASSGSTTFCQGNSVILTASGSSSYSWQPGGATTASITVSTAGTYTVTGAAVACPSQQATQTITVDPSPVISGTAVVSASSCGSSNGSVTGLSATGPGTLTYIWSDQGGTVISSSTVTADLNNQAAGSYTLLVINSGNSCSATAGPFSIGNSGAPAAPSAGSNGPVCAGSPLNLTAVGTGGTYNWTGPNTFSSSTQNPTVSPNATTAMSGDYFVTETAGGCTSLPGMIHVDVNPFPSAVITPSSGTTFCAGGSVTLNGSGTGSTFLWVPGNSTASSINANTSGTYLYIATNSCGTDTASIAVTADNVTALFTTSTVLGLAPLTVNFTNTSSASANNFIWNFGDNSTSTGISPSVIYQNPGSYVVTLTAMSSTGCMDSYSVTVIVMGEASSLLIPNIFTPNGDGINDQFRANGIGIDQFECKIYDRWGVPMAELASIQSGWDGRISSGAKASDGTYYYIMKAKGWDGKEYNETGYVQLIGN